MSTLMGDWLVYVLKQPSLFIYGPGRKECLNFYIVKIADDP